MSNLADASSAAKRSKVETGAEKNHALNVDEDRYGGVVVKMKEPMEVQIFASLLAASMAQWRQQGKKGVWIELPIELVYLAESIVKEGFHYHHAEPNYLMLVCWLPQTDNELPSNASHRVGIGAFVVNQEREVLVVQERSGSFAGTGVWKLPTGVVNEGEDIPEAAVREVKEETGVVAEFVEVLAVRQSHKSFFTKSDLLFICMLRPRSKDIQIQEREIAAAKWMPIEEYTAQPFVQEKEQFRDVANICLTKIAKGYTGFTHKTTITGSGKTSGLFFNGKDSDI